MAAGYRLFLVGKNDGLGNMEATLFFLVKLYFLLLPSYLPAILR
jgi:hypothetical protein